MHLAYSTINQMNHRTHSGSSPTVITNPNVFDSSNSTKTISSTSTTDNNHRNHYQQQHRSHLLKDRLNSTATTNKLRSPTSLHFDALESIGIDGVTVADGSNVISQFTVPIPQSPSDKNHDNNAHISAVFKKLTTYFSTTSHKTLTNLKFNYNNHNKSSRKLNHIKNKATTQQLGDDKQINRKTNTRDHCTIFKNCNAISVPTLSSNESECSDEISSLPIFVTTPHTKEPSLTPTTPITTTTTSTSNIHHSSDRISVNNKTSISDNAMCRADDKYAHDGRSTTINTTTMPSTTQSVTKRTKDLKSIDATGETFSLPRVSLRQR